MLETIRATVKRQNKIITFLSKARRNIGVYLKARWETVEFLKIMNDCSKAVQKEFERQGRATVAYLSRGGKFERLERYARREHPEVYDKRYMYFPSSKDLIPDVIAKSEAGDKQVIDKYLAGWSKSVKPEQMSDVITFYSMRAANLGGKRGLYHLGFKLAFNLKNTAIIGELKNRGEMITGNITQTTLNSLRNKMYNVYMKKGMTSRGVRTEIQGMFKETYRGRATTIARTECGSAQMHVQNEAYKRNGSRRKQWLSTRDNRTRETHQRANRQKRDFDRPFNVGAARLMFPLDPGGAAAEVVNCYDDKTEVLTIKGYKFFYMLTKEDLIAVMNPATQQLEYMKPKKIIQADYKGKLTKVKNRAVDLMITPNHNLAVVIGRSKNKNSKKVINLKPVEEMNTTERIPKKAKWVGKRSSKIKIGSLLYDTKLFMRFLGWYISEGSITKIKRGKKYQISIHQKSNTDNYNEIAEVCKKIFNKVWLGEDKIYTTDSRLDEFLIPLGKSYEKYIPQELKELDREYLDEFLDSFNKGDGSIQQGKPNHRKRRIFFTSSNKLADDIAELIIKCGKAPSFRFPGLNDYKKVKFKNGSYYIKHPCIWVFENVGEYFHVNKNDCSEMVYDGTVHCVEMPKFHIINVRRNGKVMWCGNCRCDFRVINIPGIVSNPWTGEEAPPPVRLNPTQPQRFIHARNKLPKKFTPFVTKYSQAEYKKMGAKFHVTPDGLGGYALTKNKDLVSVYNIGTRGNGKYIVNDAIRNGAKTLDCFDGKLTSTYKKYGFVETKRLKWSDEYAPKDWNYKKYGRPDIVYMKLGKTKPGGK